MVAEGTGAYQPPEQPPVGVSDNVIEASWHALVDAISLELMRLTEQDENIDKVVEDYCWGV
jgi:2-isopropylmalate synthase